MDMNNFSVFNYENLSDSLKADFNRFLAQRLSSCLKEIKGDVVLGSLDVDGFIAAETVNPIYTTLVSELYSKVSAGIQVGSGNQNLYHAVLAAFAESWKQINMK